MWFNNLIIFQLQESPRLTRSLLEEKLAQHRTRTCGKLERLTLGFTSPLGEDNEDLVCEVNGYLIFALKKIEKILPTQVVRDHVKERIAQIEQEQDRKVGSRERRNLMDETALNLLPRAFEKSNITYAYFDIKNQWLLIDTSNLGKVEEITVMLRQCLGSLKVIPVKTHHPIKNCLTRWLQYDETPRDFTIDELCEMQDPNSAKTLIKCVNQNLYTDEVKAHLATGKLIIQMALTWNDRVSFIVDESFIIKRIRLLDLVQSQLEDYQPETKEEGQKADFAIFTAEFALLVPELIKAFGGIESFEVEQPVHEREKELVEA